ncbi:MAG: glycosyltransferase family 2 protein [Polyangiales bacterium]
MTVLIVVLNYRTPTLVVRCLESLKHEVEKIGSIRVVVTDNDSGDDSIPIIGGAIEANHWDWCTLMPLPHNGGYSYGNNEGIRAYLNAEDPPRYVMLLNPDAYVLEGAVSRLVEFMDAHPEAGVAGARVKDGNGAQANSAFRFPSVVSEMVGGFKLGLLTKLLNEHQVLYELGDDPMRVDWVTCAAMMIRKEVLDEVGLLDDGYFLYFDEVDFCLRANRAGWPAYYVPDSNVVHLQAQSTGITDQRKPQPRYPDYWFDSRRRYFIKNHGKVRAALADLAFLGGYSTFRIRTVLQRKPNQEPPHFWWDFLRHSTFVRGFDL